MLVRAGFLFFFHFCRFITLSSPPGPPPLPPGFVSVLSLHTPPLVAFLPTAPSLPPAFIVPERELETEGQTRQRQQL